MSASEHTGRSTAEGPRLPETTAALVIRAAQSSEVVGVLELWRESRGEFGKTDDPATLGALLERDQGALLIAELEGGIVGSLIAVWDGWRGNMYRLTVKTEFRRQGVARRLVAAGESRLRALGARRISVLVWRDDHRAVGVWRSAGYSHEEGTGRFVKTVP
jgi:ribosomal protein S18 acetylase RimI-like enzyme